MCSRPFTVKGQPVFWCRFSRTPRLCRPREQTQTIYAVQQVWRSPWGGEEGEGARMSGWEGGGGVLCHGGQTVIWHYTRGTGGRGTLFHFLLIKNKTPSTYELCLNGSKCFRRLLVIGSISLRWNCLKFLLQFELDSARNLVSTAMSTLSDSTWYSAGKGPLRPYKLRVSRLCVWLLVRSNHRMETWSHLLSCFDFSIQGWSWGVRWLSDSWE